MKRICFLFVLLSGAMQSVAQSLPYRDKNLPVEKRVQDLLGRMTLEEKFWQLFMIPGDLDQAKPGQYKNGIFGFQVSAGAKGDAGGQMLSYRTDENAINVAKKINNIQKYFVEETRLGIPIIAFDEALHGLVRDGATAFPQAIGLAATWDTTLMRKVAVQIAKETKQRGIRQILSPVVNIASDVRWGRTEETYGEDPFLTSAMGVAFMRQFEQMGIITTPKHFIANVGDGGRDSYPIHANERLLDEVYLPPFKAAIQKAGARSIMTAYNSLDGTAASANHWLLIDKLKKEWGFNGFVISDANAVGGEVVLHYTAKDYAESGEHAINNGLDVIFQTEFNHYKLFIPAFLANKIDSARLNDAVGRVLRAKFELGLFENPYVSEDFKDTDLRKTSKEIALEAGKASFVLLKNENQVLPISPKVKTIAVFGADAQEARLGGYSGPGTAKVSILEGIRQRAGKQAKVLYAQGADRNAVNYVTIPAQYLHTGSQQGLKGDYFANMDMQGQPAMSRIDQQLDFHWTLFSPSPELAPDFYAVRWTGTLTAPETGRFKIGLEGNDGYRLYINNRLVVNRWNKQSYHSELADYSFEKGKKYEVRVEFYEANGDATIKLVWNVEVKNDWKAKIQEAVSLAKTADLAIAVVGINEGEFSDRALLSLPGHQEELIQALAATGKPVAVILVGGSAVTMNAWMDKVKAIGAAWYPGEEGGHAVASVLFGDYNPAGRLPITFPQHEAQLPLVYNHKPTGRGNDYNNLSGVPLFPFGYGLSYTRFAYSNFLLSKTQMSKTDSTMLSFTLKNTGSSAGEEVVQLYIRDLLSSVARPVMELKGFQRIRLKAGESRQVTFNITPELLSMLNREMQTVVEPGDFRIMVGSSSRDLRLKGNLQVQ
ncbi:glycoside hydrolase family 3 N-terminal domain-containing protein [Pedobacter sp. KR3-3]|uniref:Glycoside hydrolase family 3 N-terminal domain-containing protein n=1 Tax=Pedobacter albus TaxID=3113905 RepID=A0ABU7I7Y0_9SPHI|nr:glycoside hydrolase family 3 N-terminal domain-containing protein [Pedobacter sp. KR3-3]MEE1945580.1 glycoside hydrolase family 3 N-terminal domain-containing protein [Pedobacter sp. KR3-3]